MLSCFGPSEPNDQALGSILRYALFFLGLYSILKTISKLTLTNDLNTDFKTILKTILKIDLKTDFKD